MIRALGSMVMKKEEDALFAGVAIHLVSGVIFAFLYVGIWSFLPLEAMREFILFGILSGTFHGLVVSFLLITLVAGRHPVERFRNAGIGVGVAHLIGHVAYGAAVGAFAGKFRLRLEFIADMAS